MTLAECTFRIGHRRSRAFSCQILSLNLAPLDAHSLYITVLCSGVWQGRNEAGNPLQKHDVELIKGQKR